MLQRLGSKLVKHKNSTLYEKLESLDEGATSIKEEVKTAIGDLSSKLEPLVNANKLYPKAIQFTDLFDIYIHTWEFKDAVVIETKDAYHVSCILRGAKSGSFSDVKLEPISFKLPVMPYGGGMLTRANTGLVGTIDAGTGDVGSSLVFNNLGSSAKSSITLNAIFWKRKEGDVPLQTLELL